MRYRVNMTDRRLTVSTLRMKIGRDNSSRSISITPQRITAIIMNVRLSGLTSQLNELYLLLPWLQLESIITTGNYTTAVIGCTIGIVYTAVTEYTVYLVTAVIVTKSKLTGTMYIHGGLTVICRDSMS